MNAVGWVSVRKKALTVLIKLIGGEKRCRGGEKMRTKLERQARQRLMGRRGLVREWYVAGE